jgi:hypothetical protein
MLHFALALGLIGLFTMKGLYMPSMAYIATMFVTTVAVPGEAPGTSCPTQHPGILIIIIMITVITLIILTVIVITRFQSGDQVCIGA